MTDGGWPGLLRGREGELLLDLVYVFTLTRLSQRFVEDFTADRHEFLPEVGQTSLLLLALWLIWIHAAWMTSNFDPRQPAIQWMIIWVIFGSAIIAVALPHAFGARAVVFAVTYVAIQLGMPLFLLLAPSQREQHNPARTLCWAGISAVPWIAGAALFPQSPARGLLWTLAIALDYAGLALGWPLPKLGRTRIHEWHIAAEHLAERYQLFIIITLGETILLIGLTYADQFMPGGVLPTVMSFATTMLIWRIYFHRAGAILPAAITAARRPALFGFSGIYTHLGMVTGIIATGIGHALVIDHPLGHLDPIWLLAIFGGPALFLAGRSRLEYDVFARVSPSRVIALLALATLTPAMLPLPPLIATSTAALILAAVAARDAVRERRRPTEAPSPPQ